MAALQYTTNPAPQHMAIQGQHGDQATTYMVQNPNRSENYNTKSGIITGWIQISCAIACFVFGVVQFLVSSPVGFFGTGLWSGVLIFLPTGILGVHSHKKNSRVIVAYIMMSIISAIVAFNVLGIGIIAAVVSHMSSIQNQPDGLDDLFSGCTLLGGSLSCGSGVVRARIAFDSLLAIAGLLELIVAIIAACLCCGAVCCGRTVSSSGSTMVYQMPMTVPSYGQPIGVGQPTGNVGQHLPPANQLQARYQVANPQKSSEPEPQPNDHIQEQELTQAPTHSDVQPLLLEEM